MTALKVALGWSLGVAFIAIWAEIVSLLLRLHCPEIRSRFWKAAFHLSLALPVMFLLPTPRGEDGGGPIGSIFVVLARGSAGVLDRAPLSLAGVLLPLWGAIALMHLVRLGRGLRELADLTRAARPIQVGGDVPFPVLETARVSTPSASFVGNAVLVPLFFADLPAYWKDAVVTHESIHLRRRHGYAIVMEEVVRSLFWFHPLMTRLISRVRGAREELVDAETVAAVGNHAEYRELLIALATRSRTLAPAVSGADSLCARLRSLTTLEKRLMPNLPHARILCAVLAMAGTTVSAYEIASSAALNQTAPKEESKKTPVAERMKIGNVNPIYPEGLKEKKASGIVLLDISISPEGVVTEVSVHRTEKTAKTDPAFVRASIDAVRQWTYQQADKATKMTIAVSFRPNRPN